jgi:hypothetical protein
MNNTIILVLGLIILFLDKYVIPEKNLIHFYRILTWLGLLVMATWIYIRNGLGLN